MRTNLSGKHGSHHWSPSTTEKKWKTLKSSQPTNQPINQSARPLTHSQTFTDIGFSLLDEEEDPANINTLKQTHTHTCNNSRQLFFSQFIDNIKTPLSYRIQVYPFVSFFKSQVKSVCCLLCTRSVVCNIHLFFKIFVCLWAIVNQTILKDHDDDVTYLGSTFWLLNFFSLQELCPWYKSSLKIFFFAATTLKYLAVIFVHHHMCLDVLN